MNPTRFHPRKGSAPAPGAIFRALAENFGDGRTRSTGGRTRGRVRLHPRRVRSPDCRTRGRTAGFPTCCIADFPIGRLSVRRARQWVVLPAGWETRETADLEVCGTKKPAAPGAPVCDRLISTHSSCHASYDGNRPDTADWQLAGRPCSRFALARQARMPDPLWQPERGLSTADERR